VFRLLRLTRRRFLFFRKVRIGLRLIRASLRAVVFDHRRYALFCFLIAFTQLIRFKLSASIAPRLPLATIITEYLIGQNFFEILADYFTGPLTTAVALNIIFKSILFLFEIFVLSFITLTLVYYISAHLTHKPTLLRLAFRKSLAKQALLLQWSVLELFVALVPALIPFVGDILILAWQLATTLAFQIMAYEHVSIQAVLKRSFTVFKERVSTVVSIDVFLEILFIAVSALFYFLYRTQAYSTLSFIARVSSMHIVTLMSILYILAVVMVAETVALTLLYDVIQRDKKNTYF